MPDPESLRQSMVDRLAVAGEITAGWESAMRAVPRHTFLPEVVWRFDPAVPGRCGFVPLDRVKHPHRWMLLAYADEAVTTQVDDGTPAGPEGLGMESTSSASMPLLVARMLTALQVAPGHRVLEIGTGTGYNAALLAHRLGAQNVTSIEIDPAVAERARSCLHATGYTAVHLVIGDGSLGHPPQAPYDRVLSTAGVVRVPYQWVRQTRPGGRILTPWAHPYLPALVAFTVGPDRSALGTVIDPGMDFMPLRGQRSPGLSVADVLTGADPNHGAASNTKLHPYHVTGDRDAAFAIGQRVPSCTQRYWTPHDEDDHGTQWFLDPQTRSWARLRHHPEQPGPYEVQQGGTRRLWDEVQAAYHWWQDNGRPAAGDWRIEIRATRQRVTLPTAAEVASNTGPRGSRAPGTASGLQSLQG